MIEDLLIDLAKQLTEADPGTLVKAMQELKAIRTEVENANKDADIEIKAHKKRLEAVQQRLIAVQKKCKHQLIRDHNGGGYADSWDECRICGADVHGDKEPKGLPRP